MRTTLKIPPGIRSDSTMHGEEGQWMNASNVRFGDDGNPEVIRGWESLTKTLLTGVCRAAFPWTDNRNALTFAFGTHSNLHVWQGGGLYDMTPTLALPPATFRYNPLAVTDGSPTITVTHPGHGLAEGEDIALSGSPKIAGVVLADATFEIASVVDADTYTITAGSDFDLTATLGASPLSVVLNSLVVTVTQTAHNLDDGASVTIAGATAVGGITPNGTFEISVKDANTYTFFFTTEATSTATGGGSSVTVTYPGIGGSGVVIAPQRPYAPGAINGTGTAGYGTGAYGIGGYGISSTTDYFPRTWSFGAWGENLLANFRDGPIYSWTNDIEAVAEPLKNGPARVNYMLVAPTSGAYQVFALGCSEEASGEFNPMAIRHSSIRKNTEWHTAANTTAREYILPGGGRIVAGRMVGSYMLVWTSDALFVGSFIGSITSPWRFDRVGQNCGLIGPNAVVVSGQSAFWISPDRQFYSFSGGAPTIINCPIRDEFADNLAASQSDKIVASSLSEFGEVRWDYPDARDGFENSRYLLLKVAGPLAGIWSKGIMARTAMVDAGPSTFPCGVTFGGNVYWAERGVSADGSPFSWFVESADQMIGEDRVFRVTSFWPDTKNQLGPIYLTVFTRFKPNGPETSKTYAISATDEKIDINVKGRYLRLRFSGSSSPTGGRLGAPVFEIIISSRR